MRLRDSPEALRRPPALDLFRREVWDLAESWIDSPKYGQDTE
jgi:hypothetical protein